MTARPGVVDLSVEEATGSVENPEVMATLVIEDGRLPERPLMDMAGHP